jgi:adenine phosphoribosyltransferase
VGKGLLLCDAGILARELGIQQMSPLEIKSLIVDVPDFPKPGIVFKDITPVLAHPAAFRSVVEQLAEHAADLRADAVLAIESRGFIVGAPLAQLLGVPLHLVRKRGKLPRAALTVRYELEYGFDHLEMHSDSIRTGGRYLIVDDVIATGGTAAAVANLVVQQGATVAACLFMIELTFLAGRAKLAGVPVVSLITY